MLQVQSCNIVVYLDAITDDDPAKIFPPFNTNLGSFMRAVQCLVCWIVALIAHGSSTSLRNNIYLIRVQPLAGEMS